MTQNNASPEERILVSLDEESSEAEDYSAFENEVLPTNEIERLALEHVTLKLDNLGLNYHAGLQRVRKLVGDTAEHQKEDRARPTTHDEKRNIFERHFLFGKLNANEIDALISYARVERYRAGREIFTKGSPGQSLMAVLRGSVKISSLSGYSMPARSSAKSPCSMARSEVLTRLR